VKFYIASALANYQAVLDIASREPLRDSEFTYNWAKKYKDSLTMEVDEPPRRELSAAEVQAVKDAELFIFLLPGGRGAHVEYGVALADQKKIIIYNPEKIREIGFYELSTIVYNESDLLIRINTLEGNWL
jgi:hypothetical protein